MQKDEARERLERGELTAGVVCDYLGLSLPDELLDMRDEPLHAVSLGVLATEPGDMYFSQGITEAGVENVRRALDRGAECVVARPQLGRHLKAAGIPYIECRAPRGSIIKIARVLGERRHARTIAVTGSIGKTSAKDMIRLVCASTYKTRWSASNQNGLPQVIRYVQNMPEDCEIHIQEVGLSKPGSIDRAARVLRPDMFVITNIGLNHVGYFEDGQRGILAEKLNVDKLAAKDAVGFINADDPLLRDASYRHRVVTFGIENVEADVHAENIVERNGAVLFDAVERDGSRTPIRLNIVGRHNVYNALCAFAVGRELGIDTQRIVNALARFRAQGVRQNLVWLDGYHVYLDCYNASEGAIESTASALETIDPAPSGKRVLVVADIDDKLGALTEEVHRRVGCTLAAHRKGIGLVIFYGEHMAWAAEEARRAGATVLATTDRSELEDMIRERVSREDVIAFKGGQQMRLALTLDNLFGTDFFMLDGDMVGKATVSSGVAGGFRYRVLDGYGAELTKFLGGRAMGGQANTLARKVQRKLFGLSVDVPASFEGAALRVVGSGAFARTHAARVKLPEGLQALGYRSFYRCRELREIVLPKSLRYIGEGAFAGCVALERVVVPEGVGTIAARAFAGCTGLREVTLPPSVHTVAEDAFDGCSEVVVRSAVGHGA